MADDDQVMLQSCDGQDFKVEYKVIKQSGTLANLIEDAGVDAPIPLPPANAKALAKVVEWCKYHFENPTPPKAKPEPGELIEKRTDDLSQWDKDFCSGIFKDDMHFYFYLLDKVVNYLAIPEMLEIMCKWVADQKIKGLTPEEIRANFGIKGDFTEEERAEIDKEMDWCKEEEI